MTPEPRRETLRDGDDVDGLLERALANATDDRVREHVREALQHRIASGGDRS